LLISWSIMKYHRPASGSRPPRSIGKCIAPAGRHTPVMPNHPAWFHLSGVVHAAEKTFKAERLSIAGLVLMGSWLLAIALPPIERGSAGPPLKLLAWSLKRLLRWLVDRRAKRPSELRLRLAHELGVTRLAFSGAGAPGDHNGHGREPNRAHHSLLIHRAVICGCAKAGQRQGERAAYPHINYLLFFICSFLFSLYFVLFANFPRQAHLLDC
jgi:hypothetical protein